ncbi:hypothetical protein Q4534_06925 [Cyclobacterium sp. 1_MG-2023]|uniref:hypothetical protein n=1 Tax=Cyclobacterium sp. 1_MG-2023 TaxID=3062681 RepID=UPI0026E4026D|nr:hypothetical protein [Cyclobacterium sp. 1_MG-2023]MDO6437129.1 hypothetical protein [Cyclobacterium sp. 1_MG-2023]
MKKDHNFNFRKEVLKALHKGIIGKVEAKECLKRDFERQEIPVFYFSQIKKSPLFIYVDALEKMGIINPLIRLNGSFPE